MTEMRVCMERHYHIRALNYSMERDISRKIKKEAAVDNLRDPLLSSHMRLFQVCITEVKIRPGNENLKR